MLALAQALVQRRRWVAYELLYHHPSGLSVLDLEQVERYEELLDLEDGRIARERLVEVDAGRATPVSRDEVARSLEQ